MFSLNKCNDKFMVAGSGLEPLTSAL